MTVSWRSPEVGREPVGRLGQPLRVLAPHRLSASAAYTQPLGVLAHLVQRAVAVLGPSPRAPSGAQPTPVLAHQPRQHLAARAAPPSGPGRVGDQPVEGIEQGEVALRGQRLPRPRRQAARRRSAYDRVEPAPAPACGPGSAGSVVEQVAQPVADHLGVARIRQAQRQPPDLVAERVGHVAVEQGPERRQRGAQPAAGHPGPVDALVLASADLAVAPLQLRHLLGQPPLQHAGRRAGPATDRWTSRHAPAAGRPARAASLRCTALGCDSDAASSSSAASRSDASAVHQLQLPLPPADGAEARRRASRSPGRRRARPAPSRRLASRCARGARGRDGRDRLQRGVADPGARRAPQHRRRVVPAPG